VLYRLSYVSRSWKPGPTANHRPAANEQRLE
jgi:hypothetical protein